MSRQPEKKAIGGRVGWWGKALGGMILGHNRYIFRRPISSTRILCPQALVKHVFIIDPKNVKKFNQRQAYHYGPLENPNPIF